MASGGAGGGGGDGGDGGGGGGVCSWVTLATNDVYSGGALVLAQSLRDCATAHRLTVLVTPAVSPAYRQLLAAVFDEVVQVDVLDSGDVANLTLMKRPELGVTLTKLHAWTLTQYCKCVFLDADCLVVSQCDELFDRDEISAAVDIGWPDCFNSGVFVFTPSHDTFRALIRLAETTGSFDGGDQGLLNEYFSGWSTGPAAKRLSFLYNMVISATYTCSTAFKRFGADVKIVHFLGSQKPWLSEYPQAPAGPVSEQFHQQWHQLYRSHVLPALRNQPEDPQPPEQPPPQPDQVELLTPTVEQLQLQDKTEQAERRRAWEYGQPDYMGADRFDTILAKIDRTISGADSSH